MPIGCANGLRPLKTLPILHMVTTRVSTFCFEEAWVKKKGHKYNDHVLNIGNWRQMAFRTRDSYRTNAPACLKASPHDPPRNIASTIDNLKEILRATNERRPNQVEVDGQPSTQSRIPVLIGIFFNNISSPHSSYANRHVLASSCPQNSVANP